MSETNGAVPHEGDPTTHYIRELSAAMLSGSVQAGEMADAPPIGHSLAGMVGIIQNGFAPPRCPRPLPGRRHASTDPVAPGIAAYATKIAGADTNPLLSLMDSVLSRHVPGTASYDSINHSDLARETIAAALERYDLAPVDDETHEAAVTCKMGSSFVQIRYTGGGIRVTTWDGRLTVAERARVDQEYDGVMRQGLGLVQLHHYAHAEIPPFAEPIRSEIEANGDKIDASFAEYVRQVGVFTEAAGYRRVRLFGDVRHCVPVAVHILARSRNESDPLLAPGSLANGSLAVNGPGQCSALSDPTLQWRIAEDGSIQRIAHES